jgi:undecaprenyl-diphosphatase
LSLIVIGAIYAASLFAGLVDEVYEAEELKAFDEAVFAAIESYRSAALVAVFRFITALGSTETLVAVTLVATGFLLAHGPRRYVGPLWVVIVGSQLTTWMGKFLVDRGRPDFILDVTAASPSFPSAHAAGATAIYGVIAYALARDLPGSWRLHVGYWTVVLAALIGASRVFLNVHFASDVAAGHLVGIFWLLLGIAMAEHRRAGESG